LPLCLLRDRRSDNISPYSPVSPPVDTIPVTNFLNGWPSPLQYFRKRGWTFYICFSKQRTLWSFCARNRYYPEMELLDINLTEDLSNLLHAIHSLFCSTGGF
jgi:hypothetical protein